MMPNLLDFSEGIWTLCCYKRSHPTSACPKPSNPASRWPSHLSSCPPPHLPINSASSPGFFSPLFQVRGHPLLVRGYLPTCTPSPGWGLQREGGAENSPLLRGQGSAELPCVARLFLLHIPAVCSLQQFSSAAVPWRQASKAGDRMDMGQTTGRSEIQQKAPASEQGQFQPEPQTSLAKKTTLRVLATQGPPPFLPTILPMHIHRDPLLHCWSCPGSHTFSQCLSHSCPTVPTALSAFSRAQAAKCDELCSDFYADVDKHPQGTRLVLPNSFSLVTSARFH